MVLRTAWRWFVYGIFCAALAGAGCSENYVRADIQHPLAAKRILAIRGAGEHKDRAAVPALVDRLDDEDEAVRFYAILSLERITGDRLGFDYRLRGAERAAALERWRRRVADGEFRPPAADSTDGPGSAADRDPATVAAQAQ